MKVSFDIALSPHANRLRGHRASHLAAYREEIGRWSVPIGSRGQGQGTSEFRSTILREGDPSRSQVVHADALGRRPCPLMEALVETWTQGNPADLCSLRLRGDA